MAGWLDALLAPAKAMSAQPPEMPGLLGQIHKAIDPVQAFGGYGNMMAMALPPGANRGGLTLRRAGQKIGEDFSAVSRPDHVYRGMTEAEFKATLGKGSGVRSRQDYSIRGEGTSFSKDFADAESYVNYGRHDPRATGSPTYMVEVKQGPSLKLDRDGYFKAQQEIPREQITRVWRSEPDAEGNLVAKPYSLKNKGK